MKGLMRNMGIIMADKICIVGLGYVGLPLAVAFARQGEEVIGFDINNKRIEELKSGKDITEELEDNELQTVSIEYTSDPKDIKNSNFIIVAVPTPIDSSRKPDLSIVKSASKIVGENIQDGAIVVFESTVYPGVTEEICAPIIEEASGLKCGEGFKIGYSPERINPGDKEHTVEKIIKVVSGMDKDSTDKIAEVYEKIIKAGVFRAASIKTAEAAKVIENIQRDLNIALMNELSLIFEKLGINTKEVLDAAATKWNFHKYHPGLVGGHCIGVDPYYLTYKAQELGYDPQVILAGRKINDWMPEHVADRIITLLNECEKVPKQSKVLVMGLTFKENVKDTRNSRIKITIDKLKEQGVEIIACDPMLDNETVEKQFGVRNIKFEDAEGFDGIVLSTVHDEFRNIGLDALKKASAERPVLFDVKSVFSKPESSEKGFYYASL